MTGEVLAFLNAQPGPIAIFEAVEKAILALGESTMAVKKSQISWGNPKRFALLSLPRREAAGRLAGCLVLTFGLGRRLKHPRVEQAVDPYSGRWTHHLTLACPEDVDGEIDDFLSEAYRFAIEKTRNM